MIDQAFLGGGQKNLLALAENLDRSVFEVHACSRPDGPLKDSLRELGIPHHALPFQKRISRKILGLTRDLLKEQSFDLIHTHGGVAGFYGRWAARSSQDPPRRLVHTFHGIHFVQYRNPVLKAALSALEKKLAVYTDAVICVSEHVRAQSLRYCLVPANKLFVIKNGIDFASDPAPESSEFRSLFADLGLEAARPLIGAVARLDPIKGLLSLLEAGPCIRERLPEAHVIVVGGGPQETLLRDQIERRGAREYIHLIGERSDALNWMARFDVLVLPSLHEALPYVILEAAALQKPVVASDTGGSRELVRDGETGIIFPAGDTQRLADAVVRLGKDPDLRQDLGRNLRSSLSREYSLSRMVRETQDLYQNLLFPGRTSG
jgi:glycosyltransferase involved in cell wall biosynthesis